MADRLLEAFFNFFFKKDTIVTLSNNSTINSCGIPMTDNVAQVCSGWHNCHCSQDGPDSQIWPSPFAMILQKPEKWKGGVGATAFTSNAPCCEAWGNKIPVCYSALLWQNMGLIVDASSTFAFLKGKGRKACRIMGNEENGWYDRFDLFLLIRYQTVLFGISTFPAIYFHNGLKSR